MKRTFDIAAFCIYKSECWFLQKNLIVCFIKNRLRKYSHLWACSMGTREERTAV